MTKSTIHRKITIGWAIAVSLGLYSFYLSKRYIDNHRYEAMKARQRITNATDDPNRTLRPLRDEF